MTRSRSSASGWTLAFVVRDLEEGAALIDRALVLNSNLAEAWAFRRLGEDLARRARSQRSSASHIALRLSPLEPRGDGNAKRDRDRSISSWAAMTKRHRGRQWHCWINGTFNLDYVSTPQAMQWPDGRSKHRRQWLGCGNCIPRYVFPVSKTWWALIGMSNKFSRYEDALRQAGLPE